MGFEYFSQNGVLKKTEEATVALSNIEYSYGFGVYETLRVEKGTPFFADDHIERLMESALIIGLSHAFAPAQIAESIEALIARTEVSAFNLKILLIGGKSASDASLYILCLNPLFPDKKMYRDGVKTVTVQHERSFPHAKTLSMLGSYIAYQRARALDAYDALLADREGNIVEGTRTNFFAIKGTTLYSPPEENILLGVTRKAVLSVAADNGYDLWEGDINRSHLADYDGAFLTSTSSNIMPIRSIDDHEFGPPPTALKALMEAFDTYLGKGVGSLE